MLGTFRGAPRAGGYQWVVLQVWRVGLPELWGSQVAWTVDRPGG